MKKIVIYPAGGVIKGENDKGKISWTDADMEDFKKRLNPTEVHFVDPRYRNDCLKDGFAVFGRDLMAVKISDFIVVDARQKRGIGVGQEMLFAKIHKVPVITIAPKESHYVKSFVHYLGQDVPNYVHPFLSSTSDVIVENFEQAADWIKGFLEKPIPIKDISHINSAMETYMEKYLDKDEDLNKAIKND